MPTLMEDMVEEERVVLLDEAYGRTGSIRKAEVHTENTPLHLAFSLFLFDSKGRMLVQRRALSKNTWPGIWSNACCGHPRPGESIEQAVYRRTRYELGIELSEIECVLPEFRYRARWKGLWENEYCPVWVGYLQDLPHRFSSDEVESVGWVSWRAFAAASEDETESAFSGYSPWSKVEARLLARSDRLRTLLFKWSKVSATHVTPSNPQEESIADAV